MYVPIMKNRDEELRVISDMHDHFGETIMPLIEIIRDEYIDRFQLDATGNPVYEIKPGNRKKTKIKLPQTEGDIITLQKINQRLKGKKAFVDFFRFSEGEYENKSFKNIELAFKLSRDFIYFQKRINQVSGFPNLIPVISIKKGLEISQHDLLTLFNSLRQHNPSIAIRIEDNFLEEYLDFLEVYLTEEDFIFLDIRDKHVDSKFMEIQELTDLETDAKKILLNSPRSPRHKNGDFENLVFTHKIDNKVANIFKEYELDGFGDFGGLKDVLPEDGKGNGKGAALGLIYVKEQNAFFSIVNYDTSVGMKGFINVRTEVLRRLPLLDKDSDCLAINRIKNMTTKFGNWGTWNNITLTRYIHQQSKK